MEESLEEVDYKTFQPKHKQFKQSDYEEINWKRFSIWTGVLILTFGTLICTNFIYKNKLFEISNNFTKSIQTDSNLFNKFMNLIGELGEMNGIIFMLLIYVSFIPYSDTLFILIVLLSVLLLNGMMKLIYHDPRPYFVSKNIDAIDCSTSYGNPSGHSMFFTSVYPCMMVCIIEMINRNNQMSRKLKIITGTIVAFTVFLIVLILFGRIYLGAHSLQSFTIFVDNYNY